MKFHNKLACSLGVLALGVLGSTALLADTVYTGTLTDPATVVQEDFSLSSPGDVSIFTTSYGGGANLNGTTATAGGFQPNITLYNSDGTYVGSQNANDPMAKVDSSTGLALDGLLTESNLAAGNYIVTLTNFWTQQSATATNLSDGFTNLGGSTFLDVQSNMRSGAYALNIAAPGGPVSATPEPASFWLVLPALAGVAFFARKRKSLLS
jgi:PEP-CTERM motif-containing protein